MVVEARSEDEAGSWVWCLDTVDAWTGSRATGGFLKGGNEDGGEDGEDSHTNIDFHIVLPESCGRKLIVRLGLAHGFGGEAVPFLRSLVRVPPAISYSEESLPYWAATAASAWV